MGGAGPSSSPPATAAARLHPVLYRLLFADAVLAVDPALQAPAAAVPARIAAEIADLLDGTTPAAARIAAGAGIVGFALANIGPCIAGGFRPEQAWRVTCEFCTSQL